MGGVGSPPLVQRGIEAALRRDRLLVALSLAGVVVLAWLYLWRAAVSMHGEHGAPMTMAPMLPVELTLLFVMWIVMMAGMMLPSATPTVMLYASMVRKHAERGSVLPAVWIFASGYLLVWAGFSLFAALLQAALQHAGLLSSMMVSASSRVNAILLLAAGLYQLTPLKDRCLSKCRDPVRFFMLHWRPGPAGALRMGITHGAYCVGCCWVLMLLLFAAGVMNLAWIAVIAAFVLLEKIAPAGRVTSRLAGVALIAAGLGVLAR